MCQGQQTHAGSAQTPYFLRYPALPQQGSPVVSEIFCGKPRTIGSFFPTPRAPCTTPQAFLDATASSICHIQVVNRTERLFALAEYLRTRRTGITAEALAERFDVTVRTIHRDLTALRNASLPISSERGRGGGFALDAHYTLPPVNISAREAAILLLLLRYAKEMRLLPFSSALTSASEKVRAALSASAQRELERRLDELSFVGVPTKPVAKDVAESFERAWFEQAPIEVTYPEYEYGERTLTVRVRNLVFDRSETRANVTDDQGRERILYLHRVKIRRNDAPRGSARAVPP